MIYPLIVEVNNQENIHALGWPMGHFHVVKHEEHNIMLLETYV
jgi:hypothetical protein